MINFFTAGESHNKAMVVFIEGIPAGVKISEEKINNELLRRRKGYGRSNRQSFEKDDFEIISGIRYGETIGSPICVVIYNKDYRQKNFIGKKEVDNEILSPRPGHADLAGVIKFSRSDITDISERASARETVARVVAGSICKQFLENFDIFIGSFVTKIYNITVSVDFLTTDKNLLIKFHNTAEKSVVRFPVLNKEKKIIKLIDSIKNKGDTIGGEFVVFATGVPVGLGSHTQWYHRLNARISYYLASIPAVKSVEIGLGKEYSDYLGSQVHDEIFYSNKLKNFYRKTNNAGGIEGGISNGEPIIVKCCMKPIPTLINPLRSVNIKTKQMQKAYVVRSDICAVASCSIVAESMLAICISEEMKMKFGGDSLSEMMRNYNSYKNKKE